MFNVHIVLGDECRTERELPPLILGPEFKCKNFNFGEQYFHLHGGKWLGVLDFFVVENYHLLSEL